MDEWNVNSLKIKGVVLALTFYLCGSFVAMSFDPADWSMNGRFFCALFWAVGVFLLMGIAAIQEEIRRAGDAGHYRTD